jgi:hypothetical protein
MRSRLGIAISAGKLDLLECGLAAEKGQPLQDHIPAPFYRRAFDGGEATICGTLFSREPGSRAGRWVEEAAYQPLSRTEPDAAGAS